MPSALILTVKRSARSISAARVTRGSTTFGPQVRHHRIFSIKQQPFEYVWRINQNLLYIAPRAEEWRYEGFFGKGACVPAPPEPRIQRFLAWQTGFF